MPRNTAASSSSADPSAKGGRGPGLAVEVYSPMARALHWITVAFLLVQIPLGFAMVRYAGATNFAAPSGQLYDGHKLLGMVVLLLVAVRLLYRLSKGAPADEPTLAPAQKLVSHVTHWVMYLMLLGLPIGGWLAVSFYGPFAPFGIPLPTLVAQHQPTAEMMFQMHGYAAIALCGLIGLHVAAAIFHYAIRKDNVLARMLPGLMRR